ncbi:MAG TPA: methylmalonyl-CoA mutase family protein [Methylomirabilota bacterium]|jgi:methylmalonyl-CoA mutase N-terminal domain/subunit|nr:methylmalonyl-CoA mutase family protein [Methylomirabilota bacterium]
MSDPERAGRPPHRSTSGIEIRPVYGPADLDPAHETGDPGAFPFTRGIRSDGYLGRPWTMRQYAGFGSARETNARFRYLLASGQTGLSVAFDLPTQMGYDSDDPMSIGEVGRVGVPIDTIADMEALFDGIRLDAVSTSMTINATAAILLVLYEAVARRQGIDPTGLRGTIQNDILKEYIARGTYIYPPGPSMRLVTDTFAYCRTELPAWNTISISGYHMREAGATAVQEVAFTIADAIAYAEAAIAAGMAFDDFAPRLSFFFAAHNDLFEEAAKFRAARGAWARVARDRFGAKDPRSMTMRFHVQTGGSTLTAQQPETNVVRTTVQALSAILGGAQSLHTNASDEALGLPTPATARLALRTQQVLYAESGVGTPVDPLGGSYYVEALTQEIEALVEAELAEIDRRGGTLAALADGYQQAAIAEAAYVAQRAIETGERIVVGVNAFAESGDEQRPQAQVIDPEAEAEQVARTKAVRAARDPARVAEAAAALEAAAGGTENVVPRIRACVEAQVTLGEISDTLRRAWGEYRP